MLDSIPDLFLFCSFVNVRTVDRAIQKQTNQQIDKTLGMRLGMECLFFFRKAISQEWELTPAMPTLRR